MPRACTERLPGGSAADGRGVIVGIEDDRLWARLSEGGSTGQCGWLKDKFGLSWRIVPRAMMDMRLDSAKGQRAMAAMMQISRPDIAALQAAFDGK